MICYIFNLNYIYICLFYCTIDWWETFLMIGPFFASLSYFIAQAIDASGTRLFISLHSAQAGPGF